MKKNFKVTNSKKSNDNLTKQANKSFTSLNTVKIVLLIIGGCLGAITAILAKNYLSTKKSDQNTNSEIDGATFSPSDIAPSNTPAPTLLPTMTPNPTATPSPQEETDEVTKFRHAKVEQVLDQIDFDDPDLKTNESDVARIIEDAINLFNYQGLEVNENNAKNIAYSIQDLLLELSNPLVVNGTEAQIGKEITPRTMVKFANFLLSNEELNKQKFDYSTVSDGQKIKNNRNVGIAIINHWDEIFTKLLSGEGDRETLLKNLLAEQAMLISPNGLIIDGKVYKLTDFDNGVCEILITLFEQSNGLFYVNGRDLTVTLNFAIDSGETEAETVNANEVKEALDNLSLNPYNQLLSEQLQRTLYCNAATKYWNSILNGDPLTWVTESGALLVLK